MWVLQWAHLKVDGMESLLDVWMAERMVPLLGDRVAAEMAAQSVGTAVDYSVENWAFVLVVLRAELWAADSETGRADRSGSF